MATSTQSSLNRCKKCKVRSMGVVRAIIVGLVPIVVFTGLWAVLSYLALPSLLPGWHNALSAAASLLSLRPSCSRQSTGFACTAATLLDVNGRRLDPS
jgi:hypothetical protein